MEPSTIGTKIVADLLKGAYSQSMEWKFERLEQKAHEKGLSVDGLVNSDKRFATFMRVARAFEQCYEKEVVDFLAEALIGGVESEKLDRKPDFVQMTIGSLIGVTKTELSILAIMHKRGIYLDNPEVANKDRCRSRFIQDCKDDLGLEPPMLAAITNGLARTGLVTTETPAIGAPSPNSNKLTELARELFSYIDYAKRLTQ